MKHRVLFRFGSLLLCLVLVLSLLGGVTVYAEREIWTEEPTGWINWGHVTYRTVRVDSNEYVCNWGVRGELCRFLSPMAHDYYPDLYDGEGVDWCYDLIAEYEGGTGTGDALSSDLYGELHSFLLDKHTHLTSYKETRDLYRYTDCMVSNSDYISSFYSGIKLNGAWDSGATWNREHTWPQSKSEGKQEDDIMMLRPTSLQENSGRGNLAYGDSQGYYKPNAEAGTTGLDLRGDCARICLYCYVRWTENAGNMWGASGVVESLDVLLNWMEQDPVDTWEMGRNDAVQSITGVRNCFVDYPELAWALFGREMPESCTTPFKAEHNNFVSAPATLEARSCNEEWGAVAVEGWAVSCSPADGYYTSGYEIISGAPQPVDASGNTRPIGEDETGLFHWENGRLLFCPETECDYLVEIHFTPEGETDPCPTGHAWDDGVPYLHLPTPVMPTETLYTCTRCGATLVVPMTPPQYYDVTVHSNEGGMVLMISNIYGFLPGEKIDIPVYPDQAHRLKSITVIPDEGEPEDITNTGCFLMPACDVTVEVVFAWINPFTDVSEDKYYFEPVMWAYYHEPQVTGGTGGGDTFSPKATCKREQIMTFIWNACGAPEPEGTENPFTDVKETKYYYKAVLWAVENGIATGASPTTFGVGKDCTRAQVMTFLWNACGAPEPKTTENPFTDVKPTAYYYSAVLWAVENGVTTGATPTTFAPKATCTRAQVVTFLCQALAK